MYIMTKLKTHQLQTNDQKFHSTLAHHMMSVNNEKKKNKKNNNNQISSGKLIEKSDTSLASWQHLLVNDFHTYTCALYFYQFQQITQALILPNGNYPSSYTGPAQISVMLVRDTVLPSSCPSGAPELAQGQNRDWEREKGGCRAEIWVIYEQLQCECGGGGRLAQGLRFLEGVSAGLMLPSGVLVFRGYQCSCSFGFRRVELAMSSGHNEKQLRQGALWRRPLFHTP